jgi:hypothetical protein
MDELRVVHQLVPAKILGNLFRLSLITGTAPPRNPKSAIGGRPDSCLATGWRSVFMGTYDTWSERPVEAKCDE